MRKLNQARLNENSLEDFLFLMFKIIFLLRSREIGEKKK
jgi:hypothetical protein